MSSVTALVSGAIAWGESSVGGLLLLAGQLSVFMSLASGVFLLFLPKIFNPQSRILRFFMFLRLIEIAPGDCMRVLVKCCMIHVSE